MDTDFGDLRLLSELTTYWADEARDFTPWLAENIHLLSDALGIDLEDPRTEVPVGSKNVDIVCTEGGSGNTVIIENQLGNTDHKHMGQVILYSAGLDASIVVWVAKEFIEEHRAAIDWLNRISNKDVDFFGVQIEVWQIGSSKPAPRLNVVCKPNDWKKRVNAGNEDGSLTETKQQQQEFWGLFRETLSQKPSVIRARKALPQHWMNIAIGRSGFKLNAYCMTPKPGFRVSLNVTNDDGQKYLELLLKQRSKIDAQCGQMNWVNRENTKHKQITKDCPLGINLADKSRWAEAIEWMISELETMHSVLSPIIRDLDLADYEEPGGDDE